MANGKDKITLVSILKDSSYNLVRLQMVLDKSGLKLRDGFGSSIIHSCLSGKPQK